MDLVCLTDHDSLDGGLAFLDAHPDASDFILGEEIDCRVPDAPGLRVHLGAIGITERVHRGVQPLRPNAFEVAAYLRQEGVFFSVNHLFLLYRDELPVERYVREMIAIGSPGLEVHNGAASAADNGLVAAIADALRRGGRPMASVGGSDAHTLRWVGSAYTETPARSRAEFLADLHAGRTRTGGRHGGRVRALSEIYGVVGRYWGSLAGIERWELPAKTRLKAAALAAMLLPFQFVPAVVALRLKAAEARRVRRAAAAIGGDLLPALLKSLPVVAGGS
jgi:predicted metal-dependent phosphoesterase TrpH